MTSIAAAPPADPTGATDPRPGLAILCGELTPYRVHFHRRIAREIPELRLWTVLVRDSAWSAWKLPEAPEINLVRLAEGTLPQTRTRAGRARLQWRLAARTVRWLGERRIGAVLVNGYDELSRLRTIHWARRRDVPVLFFGDSNIRCDTITGWRRTIKRLIVPRIMRRCDAVMACGSLGREFFLRYGADPGRLFYTPYEPDYEQLEHLDPALLEDARRRFALDPARFRLVVSSRLVPIKRVDLAIDAFARVAAARPDWDLVILGAGPQRQALEARIPESLRSRVRFTGFIGQQETVTAVYRASHVLVHTAVFEPWGLVINEAVAAGLAVVSSDGVGASAELVRAGVNGRLVPPGDLPALTDAILDVTHPDRLPALRAASPGVLADWRRKADPVQGLRSALAATGALRV